MMDDGTLKLSDFTIIFFLNESSWFITIFSMFDFYGTFFWSVRYAAPSAVIVSLDPSGIDPISIQRRPLSTATWITSYFQWKMFLLEEFCSI